MKILLKAEELVMWLGCIAGLYFVDAPWWCYLLLFMGPDISMLGYVFGNKIGAYSYNLFHHKAVGVVFLVTGLILENQVAAITGLIILGHSSMDRLFGYGLKTEQGFKFTHLGIIGNK